MKYRVLTVVFSALSAAALLLASPGARAEELALHPAPPEFWSDVRELVLRCAVQPYARDASNKKFYGFLKSVCPELVVQPGFAKFALDGREYQAVAYDSEFADHGDLNHLDVRTPDGIVIATRRNVLAYGDVVLALAGGQDDFREEYDPTLLGQ